VPRKPAAYGLAAALAAFAWQTLTVHFNYQGNWTALFCIDDRYARPLFLENEDLYLFHNTGYDGMQFHIVSHDPWMKRGGVRMVDQPALRYSRILIPAMVWTLSLGNDAWIHRTYFAVMLLFLFLGVLWLGALAQRFGLHPAWGLAFAANPASIISIDRMTVDLALAALCAAALVHVSDEWRPWRFLAVLAAAPLVRETGVLLAAGACIYFAIHRRWVRALASAGTLLPALGWLIYVAARTGPTPAARTIALPPFRGLWERASNPFPYALPAWQNQVAISLDYVALAGALLLLAAAVRSAKAWPWSLGTSAAVCFAGALSVVNSGAWYDAFAFGRYLGPLMLLLLVEAFRDRAFSWPLALLLLIDARVALNFVKQALGVARGIVGV
jgi:hypothetical protein